MAYGSFLNERCPIEDCNRLTNSLDNGFLRAVITVLLRIMKFETVIHFQYSQLVEHWQIWKRCRSLSA